MKTCSCGHVYLFRPVRAVLHTDVIAPGYYFNCNCRSTLIWPQNGKVLNMKNLIIALMLVWLTACGASSGGPGSTTFADLLPSTPTHAVLNMTGDGGCGNIGLYSIKLQAGRNLLNGGFSIYLPGQCILNMPLCTFMVDGDSCNPPQYPGLTFSLHVRNGDYSLGEDLYADWGVH